MVVIDHNSTTVYLTTKNYKFPLSNEKRAQIYGKISLEGLARLQEKCQQLASFPKNNPTLIQIDGVPNNKTIEVVDDRIMGEAVAKWEKSGR
ncbi:MAG: hypothetical protein NZ901_12600 [Geminocystis sp.]|nr:hypothetical protein [Geminocystis sp.]HIK36441.1 hypothetical protein [Geminocystis sp. M7585_C2015_104]MCS7149007.1 hypothetical protein [Geminocystis sp.]MCX8077353.1 hypothetical protein [Geminocystis sp.]MDW8114824.1 hypothetical protein [Geminocystis sp.]